MKLAAMTVLGLMLATPSYTAGPFTLNIPCANSDWPKERSQCEEFARTFCGCERQELWKQGVTEFRQGVASRKIAHYKEPQKAYEHCLINTAIECREAQIADMLHAIK